MAVVMTVGSSSQRMQRRSHEGKRHSGPRRHSGWCLEKPAHLPRVPSQQSYTGCASFKPTVCLKLVSQYHFFFCKDLDTTQRLNNNNSRALINVFLDESLYQKKVVQKMASFPRNYGSGESLTEQILCAVMNPFVFIDKFSVFDSFWHVLEKYIQHMLAECFHSTINGI